MKNNSLFTKIFAGKAHKDLSLSDLPDTRRKQFGFLLKTRWRFLLSANLLTGVFVLPLIVWSILSSVYFNDKNILLSAEEQFANLLPQCVYCYLTAIPLIIIAFLGICGLFYCLRMLVSGEPVDLFRTFFKGIKQSAKDFLLLGLFVGVANFLIQYSARYLLLAPVLNGLVRAICLFVLVFGASIVFIAVAYSCSLLSLYRLSLWQLFKNSLTLSFAKLPINFLLFCATGGFLTAVSVINLFIVKILLYCLTLTFYLSISSLLWTEYSYYVFDLYINAKDYPDFVGKGLAGND